MEKRICLALIACFACSDFESPELVRDLRPMAVIANPAEVVVDIDLGAENILDAIDFSDLEDVEFCALIADPSEDRRLNYRFTACEPTRSFRCDEPDDDEDISITFGEGSTADPETSETFEEMCATLQVTPVLENLIRKTVEENPRSVIEGADIQIELRVETDGPNAEVAYTRKSARYSGRLPPDRVPNNNPTLDGFTVIREDGSEEPLPLGRCADIEPLRLALGEEIRVDPIVPMGTEEGYIQLDLELNPVLSVEALTYNWMSSIDGWASFSTGGPEDAFGNVPLPRNDFSASETGMVEVWIVQREERLGGAWFRTCFLVE